jgi:hypothetical protein
MIPHLVPPRVSHNNEKWVSITDVMTDTHFILKSSSKPMVWTSLSFFQFQNHIQFFSPLPVLPLPFAALCFYLICFDLCAAFNKLQLSRHICSEQLPFSLPVRRLLLFDD